MPPEDPDEKLKEQIAIIFALFACDYSMILKTGNYVCICVVQTMICVCVYIYICAGKDVNFRKRKCF